MAKQVRAVATREAIVSAAGVIFSRVSYSAATMAEVIEEAHVTQGALYFHFPSKQQLALEVIRRQHTLSIGAGDEFLRSGAPGLESVVVLSRELAHQITTNPVVRGGLRLSTESAESFPDGARQPYVDWIDTTEKLLIRAQAEGDVRKELDCSAAAAAVISAFTGTQMVSQALSGWTDINQRLEDMWSLIIPALAPPERMPQLEHLHKLILLPESSRSF